MDDGGSNSEDPYSCSDQSRQFYKRFFPNSKLENWADWRWQLKERIQNKAQLERFVTLSSTEHIYEDRLPLSITPYYMSLVDLNDSSQAIRRAVIPTTNETIISKGEDNDPLGEENQSPVDGLIHRYPSRVLFLATNFCSVSCRYCTRSRVIQNHHCFIDKARWQTAINYIEAHTEIRDVVLSGGDPLTLDIDHLLWLLSKLRAIKHVDIIRIGTKVPAVMPQRITERLIALLKSYHPLYLSVHFMHPLELTVESKRACEMLADGGFPLGSQTVLLKGINDNIETMRELMQGLLKVRVRPYYLYQCDPISGSGHFRTPVSKGLEIIKGLRGHISGYGVPQFVIDAPGGGGKIPLLPEYCKGRNEDGLVLSNYLDKEYVYPEG